MADVRADAESIVRELSGHLSPDHPAARAVRVAEAVLRMLPVVEAAEAWGDDPKLPSRGWRENTGDKLRDAVHAYRAALAAPAPAADETPPPCPDHREVQHRDKRPPWCPSCGWTHGSPAVPARNIRDTGGAG